CALPRGGRRRTSRPSVRALETLSPRQATTWAASYPRIRTKLHRRVARELLQLRRHELLPVLGVVEVEAGHHDEVGLAALARGEDVAKWFVALDQEAELAPVVAGAHAKLAFLDAARLQAYQHADRFGALVQSRIGLVLRH